MLRSLLGTPDPADDLERLMVRKSVGALTAGRRRCEDCGRTPLVGERIHVYARHTVVCELCRPRHRTAPERSLTVHHAERGHTVKLRARAAA